MESRRNMTINKKGGAGVPEQVKGKVWYDPSLTEEVVFDELKGREREGDLGFFREYHAVADPIYEKTPRDREAEFGKIHAKFFSDLGFTGMIEKALLEFPMLGTVEKVFVGKAITSRQEVADLDWEHKRIGIKIRAERFKDPEGFLRYLRHELRHVADALDEGFGHPPHGVDFPGASPAEKTLVADRYRTIWCTYVDGRLCRQGIETIMDKEGRYREFELTYRSLSPSDLAAAFEAIWGGEQLTHAEIMEMAQDPARLLERGVAAGEQPKKKRVLIPGSLCPLCRFPTFKWVNAEGFGQLPESGHVLEAIKKDFPAWDTEEGICERCVEVYSAKVGVWQKL